MDVILLLTVVEELLDELDDDMEDEDVDSEDEDEETEELDVDVNELEDEDKLELLDEVVCIVEVVDLVP